MCFVGPKIGIMRHQIPMIGGMMNVLSGATLFCKITYAPNIFMICVHRDSLGRFVVFFFVGIINMKIQKKVDFIALLSLIF